MGFPHGALSWLCWSTPAGYRNGCSAHCHGLLKEHPLCPRSQPHTPSKMLKCVVRAVPIPQQPHARCGPQVGGCLPLLLCRDDCHGLGQAGLQAGSSSSGVICIAGNARSCNRAPCDGASPGGTAEWGHLLPLPRQGLSLILLEVTVTAQNPVLGAVQTYGKGQLLTQSADRNCKQK